MKRYRMFFLVVYCLSLVHLTFGQTSAATASALPRLVRFGGTVKDPGGSPVSGVAGITFALYSEQTGGAPLWLETQNVTADTNGRYTALLGVTNPEGLPTSWPPISAGTCVTIRCWRTRRAPRIAPASRCADIGSR